MVKKETGLCIEHKMPTVIYTKASNTILLIPTYTCNLYSLYHNDKLCNQASVSIDINTTEKLIAVLYSLGAFVESVYAVFSI